MPSFANLADHLRSSDLADPASRRALEELLAEIRGELQASRADLSVFLGPTGDLVRLAEGLDRDLAKQLRGALVLLVQILGEGADRAPAVVPEPVAPADAPAPAPRSGVGLGAVQSCYQELHEQNELLLGEILAELGLVTHEEVELAREIQSSTDEMLGEVLVGSGVLDAEDLQMALSLQKHVSRISLGQVRASGAVDQWSLGQILLKQGKLEASDLERALALQRAKGGMLGGALVDLGMVTAAEVEEAVQQQRAARKER